MKSCIRKYKGVDMLKQWCKSITLMIFPSIVFCFMSSMAWAEQGPIERKEILGYGSIFIVSLIIIFFAIIKPLFNYFHRKDLKCGRPTQKAMMFVWSLFFIIAAFLGWIILGRFFV